MTVTDLDNDTRAISAFTSFQALLDAPGYRPSIRADTFGDVALRVAAAYDRAMYERGDARRSYVYFEGRDGRLHTSNGHPLLAVQDLLRRAVANGELLSPAEAVTLRELLAVVPVPAETLAKRKAHLETFNGPKAAHEVVRTATAIFTVGFSGDKYVAVSTRGSTKTVGVSWYAANYARKVGAKGRVDAGPLFFRVKE